MDAVQFWVIFTEVWSAWLLMAESDRTNLPTTCGHDDVIKWEHFPRNWPFVRGIHRSPVKSPHKGQWRGALMFSLICVWINGWVNNGEAGDLRRYRAHYDVTVMAPCTLHNTREISKTITAHLMPPGFRFNIRMVRSRLVSKLRDW